MSRLKKNIVGLLLVLASLSVTGSAMANQPTTPDNPSTTTSTTATTETNPLAIYGIPGGIVGLILGAGGMLAKNIAEARAIRVKDAEQHAQKVEDRANAEIVKVYKKLEEMEKKLDEVIADRDSEREDFAIRKAKFSQTVIELEERHQREVEELHDKLLAEIALRHAAEKLLAENGIVVPQPETTTVQVTVTPPSTP